MARVLVIDDDVGTLLGYKGVLRAAGHEVATAALGEDGLAAARRDLFDVVLCDQRLPDRPGIEIVSEVHESCPRTAVVLITGWSTPELMIEAKRAGATSYATKPLIGDDLVTVVHDALRVHVTQKAEHRNHVGFAVQRWTDLVVDGVLLEEDPKTVLLWSSGIAVTRSTLQHRCNAVHVTPKDSLDLVRLVRVVVQHVGEPWDLQDWLNVVDDRTARSLMSRAGLFSDSSCVPDLELFLSHQRLILRSELIQPLLTRLQRLFPR